MYEFFDLDTPDTAFDWDDEKDRINFTKHGIHFKTAARVFLDPHKLIREDTEHPEEQRYDVLGKVGKVLFVVCTFRESNTIRLISARLASPAEKARYENGEDYDE
ncbi:MAG: BrnT family toxin [Clostridia bacterium]|nr:BrnT family toxin [Clostridia bacterium]MBR7174258.1 BrnT family toxin [Clostridia bacterium]